MTLPEYTHKDRRRTFNQILTKPVKQINYYQAKKGAILGNHYHKKTTEYFFMISGEAVISINGREMLLKPMMLEVVRPMQYHTLRCMTPVKFMTFLSYINGHKNLDNYKIDNTVLLNEERGHDFLMSELDVPLSEKIAKIKRHRRKL